MCTMETAVESPILTFCLTCLSGLKEMIKKEGLNLVYR